VRISINSRGEYSGTYLTAIKRLVSNKMRMRVKSNYKFICAFRLEQGRPNILWQSVGSRAARGKIAMSAISSRLNYCVIF